MNEDGEGQEGADAAGEGAALAKPEFGPQASKILAPFAQGGAIARQHPASTQPTNFDTFV